jgi:hypothetical protein
MFRRDTRARFVKSGLWIFSRYRFNAGGSWGPSLYEGAYYRLLASQAEAPVAVLTEPARKRSWWMYRDEFYRDDEGLSALQVKALVLQRQDRRSRQLDRAVAMMEGDLVAAAVRVPIADEVKAFVWQRDGGRCVSCGGQERLEFDHIIPLALGGSNTARNLQLLCETCNREKGASIT